MYGVYVNFQFTVSGRCGARGPAAQPAAQVVYVAVREPAATHHLRMEGSTAPEISSNMRIVTRNSASMVSKCKFGMLKDLKSSPHPPPPPLKGVG